MDSNRETFQDNQYSSDEEKVRSILQDLMREYQENEIEVKEPEKNKLSGGEYCCLIFFNFIFLIFIYPICWGFFAVQPLEAKVLMFLGKVIKVIKSPGLKWYFPIGMQVKTVSLGRRLLTLRNQHDGDQRLVRAGQKRFPDERFGGNHVQSDQPDGLPVQRRQRAGLHQGSGLGGAQENHVQVRLHE